MNRRTFNRSLLGLPLAAALPEIGFAESPFAPDTVTNSFGGSITDVPGLKVGHHTLTERPTGCTVLLCENGATAGVDVRGSAPGTRETDLLNPINSVQTVNAIVLSGGSAYGLDTATGVMRYLEEHKMGYPIGPLGVVPIVPAAILMDLGVGDFSIRPNAEAGYQACVAASNSPVPEGNVGAGAGATVGKLFGPKFSMKSGLGTASVKIGDTGIVVGAIVAVNAVGDVYHPETRQILAGARSEDGKGFRNAMQQILNGYAVVRSPGANTTIGAIATNAPFTKTQMTKIAQMAHDGYARTINPVHTMYDGDTIFALSTGTAKVQADESAIGAIAAIVMARAIARAAMNAASLPAPLNLPAWRDYVKQS
jgi:L-aminopeptidase/D-esterase-like protein